MWKVYLKGEVVCECDDQQKALDKLNELVFVNGYDYSDVWIDGKEFKRGRRW